MTKLNGLTRQEQRDFLHEQHEANIERAKELADLISMYDLMDDDEDYYDLRDEDDYRSCYCEDDDCGDFSSDYYDPRDVAMRFEHLF